MVKQYQKEVNEIRAERIAKNANPLSLVAIAQPHQDRKEIAKPITPPSESAFEEDNDPEQAQKDKDMQKNLALIAKYFKKLYKPINNNLRTSSNTINKNVDNFPRYKNDNPTGQFGNQRTITVDGARETETKKGERLNVSQGKESCGANKQGQAHYSYMAKIQEVPTADSGTDSEPLEHVQYDIGYNVFANKIQHSGQSRIHKITNMCLETTWEKHSHDHFRSLTALDMEVLIKTCLMPLAIKTQNDSFTFVHELKQEMHADLKDIAINELKKLIEKNKGKGVDINFEKQSILGKLPFQPVKNQPVVRQPTAYKSERSQLPRHRIASQVGVSHDLKKPDTPHSWPQVRKSSFANMFHFSHQGNL
ncbi:hypothetical protein Tco_0636210 [Tanacetum coccineum]